MGFSIPTIRFTSRLYVARRYSPRSGSPSASLTTCARSAPAEKPRPSPRNTMQRIPPRYLLRRAESRTLACLLVAAKAALDLPGQLHIVVEGFGVAERLLARGLLRRRTGEDLLDGYLELLAIEGLGYLGDSEDLIGHVPGRSVLFDAPLYLVLQIVVELNAFLQDHEERHEGATPFSGYIDDEAIGHLFDLIYGGVDLARPHPYAAAIYGRIRTTVDHASTVILHLDPIPVTPHAGVDVEATLPVTFPFRIVPEVDRHGWQGLRDDELSDLAYLRISLLIEGLDLGSQRTCL